MKTSLFLGTALSAMLVTGMAAAESKNFHAEPEGTNEVPESTAALTATADFTLDTTANTLCGKVTISPAASGTTITAMHIHTGAAGANGDVLLPLPSTADASGGAININFKNVPAATVTTIDTDATYLNIHTQAFPNGAARDQLAANGDGATCEGTATDLAAPADAGAPASDAGSTSSSTSSSSGSVTTTPSDGGATTPTSGSTADSGGCNTSGSNTTNALGMLAGLGLVLGAAAARKRSNKKA